MRKISSLICLAGTLSGLWLASAQPPFPPPGPPRGESSLDAFIARMMVFDENHDGKLSRSEMTDERLLELFDRADSNHDGVVTKAELKALYTRESASFGDDRPRDHRGDERGGPGMRPEVGQILPEMAQRALNLTAQQKASLAELQRDVDVRLDQLLTPVQKAQLQEMIKHGPGGPMPRPNGPGWPSNPQNPYR
jgi:EF hand